MKKEVYKSVCVIAKMSDLGKYEDVSVEVGTKEVTKKKGLFKREEYTVEVPVFEKQEKWVKTGMSDKEIDIYDLNSKINEACNKLCDEGYEIMQITPVQSGRYSYKAKSDYKEVRHSLQTVGAFGWGWGYGYGYSVTDKIIISAKLKREEIR